MAKFVIRQTDTGFKFDFKPNNDEVIATSEVYTTKATCQKGVASVQKNAPVAGVENQTVKDFAAVKHPKYEVYEDKGGKFRFRLKAVNGEIIAASSAYATVDECLKNLDVLKKKAAGAKVVEG